MSDEISVLYEGAPVGTAEIAQEGLYCVVTCRCKIPSDEVLRAYAETGKEPFCLGVLVPEEEELRLRRRFARSSFPNHPTSITVAGAEGTWHNWSGEVAGVPVSQGLTRTVKGVRQVAVPWVEDRTEAYLPFLRYCTPVEIQGGKWLSLEPDSLDDL